MTWFEMLILAMLLVGLWALWTTAFYLAAIYRHLVQRADWRVDESNKEMRQRVQEAAFGINAAVAQLRLIPAATVVKLSTYTFETKCYA